MRFAMADRGSVFSTRDRAIRVLAELEHAEARSGEHQLILDFTDVTHVSDSFADKFVGTVASQRRSAGLPDPLIEGTIPFVKKVIDRTLELRELSLPVAA